MMSITSAWELYCFLCWWDLVWNMVVCPHSYNFCNGASLPPDFLFVERWEVWVSPHHTSDARHTRWESLVIRTAHVNLSVNVEALDWPSSRLRCCDGHYRWADCWDLSTNSLCHLLNRKIPTKRSAPTSSHLVRSDVVFRVGQQEIPPTARASSLSLSQKYY